MNDETRRRVRMLVADVGLRGMPISRAHAFYLRRRLGIFSSDYESKMRGGSMVQLVPTDAQDRVGVARVARAHRFRLVVWSPTCIVLFDKTTLRPRVPGLVWMALGAGLGLWVASELMTKKSS